jgi:flagellar FliJ protein
MKRFRFPLRPVAVLRAHREIRAREAFAASVHAYIQSEEMLATVRARVAQFEVALFDGRRTTFNPAEEAQQLTAYRRERAAEGDAERAVFAARAEMDRCRNDYLEAHRKVEVVKRLETKARTTHQHEMNREAQAEFDDYAARRAMNRASLFSS